MNTILCGYKTCGKTSVAKCYSQRYYSGFIDTDTLVIEAYRQQIQAAPLMGNALPSIGTIHKNLGEKAFRQLESIAIHGIENIRNTIIAVGGGAVLDPNNVSYLKSLGTIVYIDVDKALLKARLLALKKQPSFISEQAAESDIKAYLNSRDTVYQTISDKRIQANHSSIDELTTLLHDYRSNYGQ